MESESDAMQVDTISSVPVPTTLDSAVQTLITTLDNALRIFIQRHITMHLGADMLSTFMPDSSSTCPQLLDFIDKKWISLFSDSSLADLRHAIIQSKSLLKGVQSNYVPDGILIPSVTTATEIAGMVETLLMAVAPSQAATASMIRRALPTINNCSQKSPQPISTNVPINTETNNNQAVILDGSNIAWRFGNSKKFSLRGALLAYEYFRYRGHHSVIIFLPEPRMDSSFRNDDTTSYDNLEKLRGKDSLVLIPGADYDDAYMCTYARRKGGIVVSNDLYRDVIYQASASGEGKAEDWSQWLTACRLSFTFRNNEFLPNPSFNWERAASVSRSMNHF